MEFLKQNLRLHELERITRIKLRAARRPATLLATSGREQIRVIRSNSCNF